MTKADWGAVDNLLTSLRAISKDVAVIVIANIKSSPEQGVFATEYFSEAEAEHIIDSLRGSGLYVHLFTSEDSFIAATLSGEIDSLPRQLKLVYNSAQTGSGPGRKSLVPSFCQLHRLPTTTSNPYVVSLARHKFHSNYVLKAARIPAPASWSFHWQTGWLLGERPPLGTRLLLKPTYESASIGIDATSIVEMEESVDEIADRISRSLNQPLTVQEFIGGFEVEVPVFGLGRPLAPMIVEVSIKGGQEMGEDVLTYEAVYNDQYSFHVFNSSSDKLAESIKEIACQVFELLGIEGLGRVDFRVTRDGRPFVTDISTNPHLIPHSSFAFTFRHHGRDQRDAVSLLVALGCKKAGWI